MSNIFNNLITKIKSKKSSINNNLLDEYAFSLEEIDNLQEENKQKIKNLKEDKLGLKKDSSITPNTLEPIENKSDDDYEVKNEDNIIKEEKKEVEEEFIEENTLEPNIKEENNIKEEINTIEDNRKKSFINLSKGDQETITKCFKEIDLTEIDKDILEAKDILNHNYNITFPDESAKFIHNIRKKYETLICYLIGFNNEKNGIENKIIFSDKLDNEWKYLENYIKLLEKIRSFRK